MVYCIVYIFYHVYSPDLMYAVYRRCIVMYTVYMDMYTVMYTTITCSVLRCRSSSQLHLALSMFFFGCPLPLYAAQSQICVVDMVVRLCFALLMCFGAAPCTIDMLSNSTLKYT